MNGTVGNCVDLTGRQIEPGDLLKVYHFTTTCRRNIYMYKLVFLVNEDLEIEREGKYLCAVDVADTHRKNSIDAAHKYMLSDINLSLEIVDGGTTQDDNLWWERPKQRVSQEDT